MNRPLERRHSCCRKPGQAAATRMSPLQGSWPQCAVCEPWSLPMNLSCVGRAFQPAGSGDFPVPSCCDGLDSPSNRQHGKAALRDSWSQFTVARSLNLTRSFQPDYDTFRNPPPSSDTIFLMSRHPPGRLWATSGTFRHLPGRSSPTVTTSTNHWGRLFPTVVTPSNQPGEFPTTVATSDHQPGRF